MIFVLHDLLLCKYFHPLTNEVASLCNKKDCAHDVKYQCCTNYKMPGLIGSCERVNFVVMC